MEHREAIRELIPSGAYREVVLPSDETWEVGSLTDLITFELESLLHSGPSFEERLSDDNPVTDRHISWKNNCTPRQPH